MDLWTQGIVRFCGWIAKLFLCFLFDLFSSLTRVISKVSFIIFGSSVAIIGRYADESVARSEKSEGIG